MGQTSTEDAKSIIMGIIHDIAESDPDRFLSYVDHIGFDLTILRSPDDFSAAWLGQYRIGKGRYDLERALNDFDTWPPIAQEIARRRRAAQS